ncbi:hypothetical protein GV64_04945 [Endozoicomonas elysicola]|uniref:Uncharacterized protein n=2 Tax=Endozoicomonas elysicola TaxID=305900 RepID=A0A081K7Q2_9GAMM|nr:hypothetical protein GV64_04945 [Endozoicomonas elysicola]
MGKQAESIDDDKVISQLAELREQLPPYKPKTTLKILTKAANFLEQHSDEYTPPTDSTYVEAKAKTTSSMVDHSDKESLAYRRLSYLLSVNGGNRSAILTAAITAVVDTNSRIKKISQTKHKRGPTPSKRKLSTQSPSEKLDSPSIKRPKREKELSDTNRGLKRLEQRYQLINKIVSLKNGTGIREVKDPLLDAHLYATDDLQNSQRINVPLTPDKMTIVFAGNSEELDEVTADYQPRFHLSSSKDKGTTPPESDCLYQESSTSMTAKLAMMTFSSDAESL